jgi:hypothetical protein
VVTYGSDSFTRQRQERKTSDTTANLATRKGQTLDAHARKFLRRSFTADLFEWPRSDIEWHVGGRMRSSSETGFIIKASDATLLNDALGSMRSGTKLG